MRKLLVTQFVSLDGVMENPGWTFPYWNDEIAAFKGEETAACDTLLLGRVTYEGFAAAWPDSDDEGAPYFNNVRKVVVSTTLTEATWNNSVIIRENVVAAIRALKQEAGGDIGVHGSATLAQTLLQHGLVDRLHLLVYPVVLGEGRKFFAEGTTATLKLIETRPFSSGAVALVYAPVRD